MKGLRKIAVSAVGLCIAAAAVCALNVSLRRADAQLDLTAGGQYTLSAGSHAIIGELERPVTLRYYVSESGNQLPLALRNHAYRVEQLLDQFVRAGKGRLQVVKYDPEPDSDAQLSATADGIQPFDLDMYRTVYFGLSVESLDRKVALPLLDPRRDALLEYDIARAVAQVARERRPRIGIWSSQPVFGRTSEATGGERSPLLPTAAFGFPPWVFVGELERQYEVVRLDNEDFDALREVDLLLVIAHRQIPARWERAIDRHLGRGGRLVALLDPFSVVPFMTGDESASLASSERDKPTLAALFDAWGLRHRPDAVVGDMAFRATIDYGQGPETYHTILEVNAEGLNAKQPVTAAMDNLGLPFVGAFENAREVPGLAKAVLVSSSAHAELVDASEVRPGDRDASRSLMHRFESDGGGHAIAVALSGEFPTAFADGADAEVRQHSEAILVADTDFLFDPMAATRHSVQGRDVVTPFNGNLELLLNSVDQLVGDSRLSAVRGRGTARRPFTRILAMQAAAEVEFQERLRALERELDSIDEQYLQAASDDASLATERSAVEREMREVSKALRAAVTSLESRLQWIGIGSMPALVAGFGLLVVTVRQRRQGAA